MIYGIGTDIVAVNRVSRLWQRYGGRILDKILTPTERIQCQSSRDPVRFLAKRFAAKEAMAKALGTGLRAPVMLSTIEIEHDALGKPILMPLNPLDTYLAERGLCSHVSISDEKDYVVAFVIVEKS